MSEISACERVVLLELLNDWESEMVSSFHNLAISLNLTRAVAKRRVRRLAGKGLAERSATFCDDGYITGSGYTLTQKGVAAAKILAELNGQ